MGQKFEQINFEAVGMACMVLFIFRAALKKLLKGDIHHMATVMKERPDLHDFWRNAAARKSR